jgi:hypothetical protein
MPFSSVLPPEPVYDEEHPATAPTATASVKNADNNLFFLIVFLTFLPL